MVNVAREGDKAGDDQEHQCLIGGNGSVDVYYAFHNYRLLSVDDYIAERRITRLSRLDGFVVNVPKCWELLKKRGEHKQKVADICFQVI